MSAIQSAFQISPVLFLPLVVVIVLALFTFPPFTAIFLGAIAGGLLAVFMAPGRVIAFADAHVTWGRVMYFNMLIFVWKPKM